MSKRLEELAERRALLRQQCALQRQQIGVLAQHIETRLSGLDRGLKFLSFFTRRPVVIAAGLASAFIFGPKRMLRWLGQGTLVIGLVRKFAGLVAKF